MRRLITFIFNLLSYMRVPFDTKYSILFLFMQLSSWVLRQWLRLWVYVETARDTQRILQLWWQRQSPLDEEFFAEEELPPFFNP